MAKDGAHFGGLNDDSHYVPESAKGVTVEGIIIRVTLQSSICTAVRPD
jgi:hypothetical protein